MATCTEVWNEEMQDFLYDYVMHIQHSPVWIYLHMWPRRSNMDTGMHSHYLYENMYHLFCKGQLHKGPSLEGQEWYNY